MADADIKSYFTNTIDMDLMRVVCGRELGSGIARTVYACLLNPDYVLKIEAPSHSFQNIREWEFWSTWQFDNDVKLWLAPCISISPCGTVLVQQRTTPIPPERFPKRLPKFLTDTKRSNYGLLNGKVVCHDYALVVATLPMACRNVDWWD